MRSKNKGLERIKIKIIYILLNSMFINIKLNICFKVFFYIFNDCFEYEIYL